MPVGLHDALFNPKTALFLRREALKLYVIYLREQPPHAVAHYLPENILTLTVAVYMRLVRRKEHVLYLIGLLTYIHLSIVVYSMCDNS